MFKMTKVAESANYWQQQNKHTDTHTKTHTHKERERVGEERGMAALTLYIYSVLL